MPLSTMLKSSECALIRQLWTTSQKGPQTQRAEARLSDASSDILFAKSSMPYADPKKSDWPLDESGAYVAALHPVRAISPLRIRRAKTPFSKPPVNINTESLSFGRVSFYLLMSVRRHWEGYHSLNGEVIRWVGAALMERIGLDAGDYRAM